LFTFQSSALSHFEVRPRYLGLSNREKFSSARWLISQFLGQFMSSAPASAARIVSMDQFRGYTVAGMFVVNFVGGLAAFPEVLKHHNGLPYFSYADTIMPSFMFAAGFSYRLSALKRFAKLGAARAYGHFVVRSLALV